MKAIEFGVLGPLTVDGVRIRAALQRQLLAVLLCRPNTTVPTSDLVDALWQTDVDTGAPRLRLQVHRLRKLLGDTDRLLVEPGGGYQLVVLPDELDSERFATARAEAAAALATGNLEYAAALLREGQRLWRGEPFADVAPVGSIAAQAASLSEWQLCAFEDLHAAEIDLDQLSLPDLAGVAAANPFRERLQGLLIIALARSGQREAALDAFGSVSRRLSEELGLEPGQELRRIHDAIMADEPVAIHAASAASPRPAVVPAELPPDVSGFTARATEIDALARLVDDERRTIAITGTAGVGKTALALRFGHQVRDRFPDGQLYVDLRGFSPGAPLAPSEALIGFLRALGVSADEIPSNQFDQAGLYQALLAGRRVLVVLDNARDSLQAAPLLPLAAGCLGLVTSRDQLVGLGVSHEVARVAATPLTSAGGKDLLARILGPALVWDESAAADRLVELCGGLPLSLRIATAMVAPMEPSPLAALVAELGSDDRLRGLSIAGDPTADVRRAFEASYNALDETARMVFRRVGQLPGEYSRVELIASAAGLTVSAAQRALAELRNGNLVDDRADSYGLHDLLKLYAAELGAEDDQRSVARSRTIDWYLQSALNAVRTMRERDVTYSWVSPPVPGCIPLEFDDELAALDWYDAEWSALLAVTDEAVQHDARRSWNLVTTFYQYLENRRCWQDNTAIFERVTASVRQLGSPADLAKVLSHLAGAYGVAGRWEESIRCYEEQAEIEADAVPYLRRSLELMRKFDEPLYEVYILANLSRAYAGSGAAEEAQQLAEQVLAYTAQNGPRWLHALGTAMLGEAYRILGDPDRAITLLDEASLTMRELQMTVHEARALNGLALALRDCGEHERSRGTARQALALVGSHTSADAPKLRDQLTELLR